VYVAKAYDVVVGRKNVTQTISGLSIEELKTLAQAIELYITITE
jgi:hypothetical protein